MQGIIKWFDRTRGFGFIEPADGSRDVFVHASVISGSSRALRQGEPVDYELDDGARGPKAIEVKTNTT